VQNNQVSSSNLQYAFTILISFLVVLGYCFYFAFWVRDRLCTDLFKVLNLFRVASLLLLAHGYGTSLLLMNFSEIFFFSADLLYYRNQKLNLPLYCF
jgi:hypothetical protein